ncbi:MAG: hypothetical protein JW940_24425 [Polyangiaceae bacterium]|nr:hypothetical protein [Polyangiaceae bacterium]
MRVPRLVACSRLLSAVRCLAVVAAVLVAAPLHAGGRTVSVTLVGIRSDRTAIEELLTEWFELGAFELVTRWQPTLRVDEVLSSKAGAELRIWLVLMGKARARVYFADAAGERFLVRDVPLRDGLDELGRERIVQILSSSAHAFLARSANSSREEIQRTFAEPTPADPLPPPTEPATAPPASHEPTAGVGSQPHPSPWGLRGGGSYVAIHRGAEGTGHGPEAMLGVTYRGQRQRLSLSLRGRYEWPHRAAGDEVTLALQTAGMRLMLGVESDPPGFGWAARFGAGWDRVSYTPRPRTQETTARRGSADFRPLLGFAVGGVIQGQRGSIAVLTLLELPLVDTHYDVALQAARRIDLAPWRVQPGLALEAVWP